MGRVIFKNYDFCKGVLHAFIEQWVTNTTLIYFFECQMLSLND